MNHNHVTQSVGTTQPSRTTCQEDEIPAFTGTVTPSTQVHHASRCGKRDQPGNQRVDDSNADAVILLDLECDLEDLRLAGARHVAGSDVITLARCCVLLAHPVG